MKNKIICTCASFFTVRGKHKLDCPKYKCEKCKAQIHAKKCHNKPESHICGNKCFYKEECCGGGCGDINCSHCGPKKADCCKKTRKKTIKDFLSGRLCHTCGGPKEDNPLSDMCLKCWED